MNIREKSRRTLERKNYKDHEVTIYRMNLTEDENLEISDRIYHASRSNDGQFYKEILKKRN